MGLFPFDASTNLSRQRSMMLWKKALNAVFESVPFGELFLKHSQAGMRSRNFSFTMTTIEIRWALVVLSDIFKELK